jgi:hypothetical protein
MGWLDRIFKLGSGEGVDSDEVLEEETVDLSVLPKWIDKKSNAGFEKVKPDIERQFSRLIDEKKSLLVNLEELREAKLQNPDISEREKQIMKGNRESYISQHKQFLNVVDISQDISCKETAFFCKNFEELLVKLAKSTAKGHAIMNEFFANHAAKINKNVREMGDAVSKVRELLEEGNVGIGDIDKVQRAISELRGKKKLVIEMREEIQILKKKLSNSDFLKQKLLKNIEQLKQTEDYSEFKEADDRRNELWKEVKQIEEEVSTMFSPINKPMRKYERILAEGVDLFKKYIDTPVLALAEDEGLRIMDMLERMKKAIEEGKLEVKDKEKALHRIPEIGREKLSEARARYLEAKKTIKQIGDKIRDSKVQEELNDLQYKIEHTDNQIKILQDKMEKAEQTKAKIDLEKLRNEAQEKIKEVFAVEVTITWQDDSPTQSQSS